MLRWTLRFVVLFAILVNVASSASAKEAEGSVNARLISYYAKPGNYRRVKRDVLSWHKTTTNGCVAFASTALRHVGFDIPVDAKRDGWGISRITFAFSDFLEEKGWIRVERYDDLRPGDLAFSTGYPDHVFVFHSWSDVGHRVARVLDNRGFLSRRELSPREDSDTAPFAYALRAPVGARASIQE